MFNVNAPTLEKTNFDAKLCASPIVKLESSSDDILLYDANGELVYILPKVDKQDAKAIFHDSRLFILVDSKYIETEVYIF